MDANSQLILHNLEKILIQSSQQNRQSYLFQWKQEAVNLLARAEQLKNSYINLKLIPLSDASQEAINRALENQVDLKIDNLLRDMYVYLNKVGEQLRGEIITYSITLTVGKGKEQKMISYELPLEDFLNITSASHTRLTLKKTSTIINQLQLNNTKKDWTPQEVFDFQRFIFNAKRVQEGRWKNVNRGNLLEAYTRYQFYRQNGQSKGSTTQALIDTLSGTQGFWQGGDFDGKQIKGSNASVANIYTCIRQINQLYTTLSQLTIDNNKLKVVTKNKVGNNIRQSINDTVNTTVEELLTELQAQFMVNK